MHTHTHTCTHTCAHTYRYAHAHAHMYMYIHNHPPPPPPTHAHTCMHTCTLYMYIDTCTHMHTHTHTTHTPRSPPHTQTGGEGGRTPTVPQYHITTCRSFVGPTRETGSDSAQSVYTLNHQHTLLPPESLCCTNTQCISTTCLCVCAALYVLVVYGGSTQCADIRGKDTGQATQEFL